MFFANIGYTFLHAGVIRIWDVSKVTELYVQQNSIIDCAKGDSGLAITNLIFNEATSNFLVSSSEHNIFIHNLETFSCLKQVVNFLTSSYLLMRIFLIK